MDTTTTDEKLPQINSFAADLMDLRGFKVQAMLVFNRNQIKLVLFVLPSCC